MEPNQPIDLNEEQLERLPAYREKWLAIGSSSAPAERTAAEAAIRKAYECANLVCPKKIVWCKSPLAMRLTRRTILSPLFAKTVNDVVQSVIANPSGTAISDRIKDAYRASVRLTDGDGVRKKIMEDVQANVRRKLQSVHSWEIDGKFSDGVWQSIWDIAWDCIEDCIRSVASASVPPKIYVPTQFSEYLGDSVRVAIWDSVRDIAWNDLRLSVSNNVRTSVWNALWNAIRTDVWDVFASPIKKEIEVEGGANAINYCYGQHDANWLAFYDFFRTECGRIKETAPLAGLIELARHAGWIVPCKNICLVSERPCTIRRGDNLAGDKMHPRLSYPDGWSVCDL